MSVQVVNQDSVLQHALDIVSETTHRLWITSPWITQRPASLLLRDALPRVARGQLDTRIVYRVKEPADLDITDLDALKALEDAGCLVRYSTRLHAKLILADSAALVSSSNLTATAGYGLDEAAAWRNEELGVVIRSDDAVLSELESQFEAIWSSATRVDESTIGIAMDFPTVRQFSFVAIRDVRLGEYATAHDTAGNVVLGRISEVTAYNPSFPQMNESMWITQGYSGTGGSSRVEVPDLQSLFSHPSKEHGFLVTKTFFEPESVFRIARVEVLKHYVAGRLLSPTVPVAPGSDVSHASPELLRQLLGDGDVELGTMLHHPDVPVALRSAEFSKHLAVLGMTGSGKSNAIKVLLHRLSNGPLCEALRVVVIDTHGEYAPVAQMISPSARIVDVRLRRSVLDDDVVRDLLRLSRRNEALLDKLAAVADGLSPEQDLEEFLAAVELEAPDAGPLAEKLTRLVAAAREADDLCLWPHDSAVITRADSVGPQRLDEAGLYILNLRHTTSLEERSAKAAAVMTDVFEHSKHTGGQFPSLVVLDEAQYYAPEQQTGWLARARPSFDAVFAIASEGRKFGVGLVVSSQRPARVNKDVLSQCNTHLVFRVANVEDLSALAGSFEAASQPLLDELPGFDTGVCVVGGTAIGMLTRVEVPLFESVAVENDSSPPSP